MYNNISKKIKGLAIAIFIILTVASIVTGLVFCLIDDDTIIIGLIIMLAGPFLFWISSWMLYGFGELIEKATEIAENTAGYRYANKSQSNKSMPKTEQMSNKKTTEFDSKKPTIKPTFLDLLTKLPEIKKDKYFVKSYSKDKNFQKELFAIDDELLQLKFIDLAYEFYDTEMSVEEWNERKLIMIKEYESSQDHNS